MKTDFEGGFLDALFFLFFVTICSTFWRRSFIYWATGLTGEASMQENNASIRIAWTTIFIAAKIETRKCQHRLHDNPTVIESLQLKSSLRLLS